MKLKVSPLRLAVLGIACYVGAVAWVAASSYLADRHSGDFLPPGWIGEHPTPAGAYYLAVFGGILVIAVTLWAVTIWSKGKIKY